MNCSGPSVDTRLVDEKTSEGRRLQYGVSVLGRRLPFWYRATFGAQSARLGPTPLVLTEPPPLAPVLILAILAEWVEPAVCWYRQFKFLW